ncbi:MAG TPA: UDP-3-O-(3-hydroxymyristoyl)glucosamine N-acyltransferase [Verrucomicrobiales bacterium]|nr:UDP-3-O-(3-hydroxymyristoyl)glucosamine N-acyltransferase [Verrucomicrobiales bacterium]
MEISLEQLAALTKGTILSGDGQLMLTGFGGLRESGPGDLSFCANDRFVNDLRKTRASAVLVKTGFAETIPGVALVACDNALVSFEEVVKCFMPPSREFKPGIHPSAVVHATAKFDPATVCIGPCAVIDEGAVIGDGTDIGAGCFVGEHTIIGQDCILFPRVTIYRHCVLGDRVRLHSGTVIGGDGFGYEFYGGSHQKIDQIGIVQIDNDVEIGANTTIDRARFGRTWIGEGTKIDNQVMIAHNCIIGKHVVIVAQTGIAGSTRIGDYSVIAAQVGVAGHLEIGPQVTITAKAGVTRNLPQKGTYSGHPVYPIKTYQEQQIRTRNLHELFERVRELEQAAAKWSRPEDSSAGH